MVIRTPISLDALPTLVRCLMDHGGCSNSSHQSAFEPAERRKRKRKEQREHDSCFLTRFSGSCHITLLFISSGRTQSHGHPSLQSHLYSKQLKLRGLLLTEYWTRQLAISFFFFCSVLVLFNVAILLRRLGSYFLPSLNAEVFHILPHATYKIHVYLTLDIYHPLYSHHWLIRL